MTFFPPILRYYNGFFSICHHKHLYKTKNLAKSFRFQPLLDILSGNNIICSEGGEMLIFLIVITQWLSDNHEAKFYCPLPGKVEICVESTHAYNVLKYELNVTVPMNGRSIGGANGIACRSRTNNLTQITVHRNNLTIDSVRVDGAPCSYSIGGDSMVINLPH